MVFDSSSGCARLCCDILSRMFHLNRLGRLTLACIVCAFSGAAAAAQATHYYVKLVPDFDRQLLHGKESVEFQADAGVVEWQKQAGLHVITAKVADGEVTVTDQAVRLRLRSRGRHSLELKYTAAPARGLRWFEDNAGLVTAFYCEAWTVCDNSPGQRATLELEIVVPLAPMTDGASGFRAVGPGNRGKEWRGRDGDHFVFEQMDAVQPICSALALHGLESRLTASFLFTRRRWMQMHRYSPRQRTLMHFSER
jgi:hypothetical protein